MQNGFGVVPNSVQQILRLKGTDDNEVLYSAGPVVSTRAGQNPLDRAKILVLFGRRLEFDGPGKVPNNQHILRKLAQFGDKFGRNKELQRFESSFKKRKPGRQNSRLGKIDDDGVESVRGRLCKSWAFNLPFLLNFGGKFALLLFLQDGRIEINLAKLRAMFDYIGRALVVRGIRIAKLRLPLARLVKILNRLRFVLLEFNGLQRGYGGGVLVSFLELVPKMLLVIKATTLDRP